MNERERILPNRIALAAQAVDRYSTDSILWDPAYRDSLGEIGLLVGSDLNPDVAFGVGQAMNYGIAIATNRIDALALLSDPEKKAKTIKSIKEGKFLGSKIVLRLAFWNQEQDPFGLTILQECRDQDIKEIYDKETEAKDELERIQKYRAQALAYKKGENMIIDFYKRQIEGFDK